MINPGSPGVHNLSRRAAIFAVQKSFTRYAERVTTLREHTALIKEYYGYHEFGDFPGLSA
jgi:hypothetical protein